jgi:hypothetical protein
MLALLAVAGLRYALPSSLSVGPDWALAAVVPVMMIPAVLLHRAGRHQANQIAGYMVTGVVTADMVLSLAVLIARLAGPPRIAARTAAGRRGAVDQ